MKRIVIIAAAVAMAVVAGCKEKTTEEKIGDSFAKGLSSAKAAAKDAAKAVEKGAQEAAKAVENATK